ARPTSAGASASGAANLVAAATRAKRSVSDSDNAPDKVADLTAAPSAGDAGSATTAPTAGSAVPNVSERLRTHLRRLSSSESASLAAAAMSSSSSASSAAAPGSDGQSSTLSTSAPAPSSSTAASSSLYAYAKLPVAMHLKCDVRTIKRASS